MIAILLPLLFGKKIMRLKEPQNIFPKITIIFLYMEKTLNNGFLIKCHERKSKIRHIKIQTMILEDYGCPIIYLQEIIIAKVAIQ